MRYLKSMAKNVLKAALFSLALLIISCNIAPTYSRQDIDKSIKKICREEFNLTVEAWLLSDTVWVYAPFKQVFNDDLQWDKATLENVRRIFLALSRVLLSTDKPPSFFAFVIADVQKLGADLYYIGFIPDMVKMQKLFISLGQWQEREVIINSTNPQALGDYSGRHIDKYDFTMGEFISYLINQDIRKFFMSAPVKNAFQINDVKTRYIDGTISILLNITPINKENQDSISPFETAKETARKFLKIYSEFDDILEVTIIDAANNKIQTYSAQSLLAEKNAI